MNATAKPWWQSKLMWIGFAQIVAGVAGLYGREIDAAALADYGYQIMLLISGAATVGIRPITKQAITLRK